MNYKNTIKLSSELNTIEIEEINILFHSSFGTKAQSKNFFQWKYLDNPFGDSFHLLTRDGNKLIASRAFWNAPVKENHFQCVDTCVDPAYRGKGIFKETTLFALENLNINYYNAPNSSSLPQYLKYGWKVNNTYKPKLTLFNYINPHVTILKDSTSSKKLINWKFLSHPNFIYKYFQYNNYMYLCRIKSSIPIILFKTKLDLRLFNTMRKPLLCATYSGFNGLGLEFSTLSYSIHNSNVLENVEPYYFDMF
mgnify:CR=1 FL=1|tara:strand:+ start:16911 stop:17663 length:753 start_codon:yes stop_codon:yes gene_type:complete